MKCLEKLGDELECVIKNEENKRIKNLKIKAYYKLHKIIMTYKNQGFDKRIVESICYKKIKFIKYANTKKEMEEILQPSVVKYNFNTFVPVSEYHIEEEEALMWSIASLKAPLNEQATKRYIGIMENIYGEKFINEKLK